MTQNYQIADRSYGHIFFYLGIGSQYGMGECIIDEGLTADIVQQESFLRAQLMRYVYNGPERFWHFLHHLIPRNPEVIRALDMASWDLWSKLNGKSVRESLHQSIPYEREVKVYLYPDPNVHFLHQAEPESNMMQSFEGDYTIVLDSYSHENQLRDLIFQSPDMNFVLENPSLLSEYTNTSQLIHFEKTQGVSDITIHLRDSASENVFYYSSSGSLITMSMLQSLVRGGNTIIAHEVFLENKACYKGASFDSNHLLQFEKSPVYGHGISL